MDKFNATLAQFLKEQKPSNERMSYLLHELSIAPKSSPSVPGLAEGLFCLLERLFMSGNQAFALKLIYVLSHYESVMAAVLSCEYARDFAEMGLNYPDVVCLFYYVSACLSHSALQHSAILAIEGLAYYGSGKRLAVHTGMLLQLDEIVSRIDFRIFSKSKIQVLECYSNILCYKQLKYVAIEEQGVIEYLAAMPSVLDAVVHAVSARAAYAACSCLFVFMYYRFEDFVREAAKANILEQLIARLCQFSASFREDEGGTGSSMCLHLYIKNTTEGRVQLSETAKTLLGMLKELYCIDEAERLIQCAFQNDQFELQMLQSLCAYHASEISSLHEMYHELTIEDDEPCFPMKAATTGNMRSGKVRNSGRISSLDL